MDYSLIFQNITPIFLLLLVIIGLMSLKRKLKQLAFAAAVTSAD